MRNRKNELQKPGPDAGILELEEYEKRKNQITVNIHDGPAKFSFVYGCLSLLAAVIGMVWNIVKPISYGGFMLTYEGFFYVLNIYRIVSGYLFAVLIIIFSLVAINLWRKSKDASPSLLPYRTVGLISSITAAAMQPISIIMVTFQAINYLSNFN